MLPRITVVFCLCSLVFLARGIPIDNGIEGEPEIECGPTSLEINLNTKNEFSGHVYVKGLYSNEECRTEGTGSTAIAGIEIPFDSCNLARVRSLNPRGIFVTSTIVISFHPQFLTKIDRAYRIQCFYMEADKTVSTQIQVSEITTAFQTATIPMPVCRYEILDASPTGQPVSFATIGQPVYHKWTCDTETMDTFCAVVHSCFVDDGLGDTIQVLDTDGCALDRYLLNNLEYPTDLMAGQEAHVYKYADRSQLFYQCQIAITIKEPNSECPRPQCAEPEGFGSIKSGQIQQANPERIRLLRKREVQNEETLDVRTDFNVMDITEQSNQALHDHRQHNDKQDRTVLCISPFAITFIAILACSIVTLTIVLVITSSRRPRKS